MFQKEFYKAKHLLKFADRIIIFSHRHPDGDSIGANLALKAALKQWNKHAVSACIDPLPQNSLFLEGAQEYVDQFSPDDFEIYVTVDCGAHYMTKFHVEHPEILNKQKPFINIDHHATNDFFGTVNIVNPEAASATQVLYEFLKYCEFEMTPAIATCLLHGLYFDTGSFKHSNVTPDVLRMASALMKYGADFKMIVKKQFHEMPISQIKLWGKIFKRIAVSSKKVTRSFVLNKDYEETGTSSDDTTGAIDYLNAVQDGRFCTLVAEDGKGMVKGSLRTRDDSVDVSKIAGLFGGGGHKKASGYSFPGHLMEDGSRVTIT